jgi:site-specific DNA-methyltransferase (adenine-specific)
MRLIHGDCLEVMPTLGAGSVDMILCDLPYGTTACKWDSVLPFGLLWDCYKRVATPNAAVVLFAAQPFTSALVMSNPSAFKYEWIWEKNMGTNGINAKRQPVRYHESILVFYESQPTYNPQMASRKETAKSTIRSGISGDPKTSSHYLGLGNTPRRFYDVDFVYPKSVLYFESVPNGGGGKLHPTQKPVALVEYLIRTYTNPGDIVLDNCMGSGTTGVACINTNRDFIGIEQDTGYFSTAERRIMEAPRPLFGDVA